MLLTRRHALATIPALAMATGVRSPAHAGDGPQPTPGVPAAGRIAFAVWREGSAIGAHQVVFTRADDRLTVVTDAHFSVGIGPLKLYAYRYHVEETWSGGQLMQLSAQTNDDGSHQNCTATRTGEVLRVTGSKSGRYDAPAGTIAATHWNAAEIHAPMINPENGVLMHFAATEDRSVPPGGGSPARHVALTGFATLDLWYGADQDWVGLRAVAKDKSIVEYRRR